MPSSRNGGIEDGIRSQSAEDRDCGYASVVH